MEMSNPHKSLPYESLVYSKEEYNQVPHLTQETIRESDKSTRKLHTQESQEASPFQEGGHKEQPRQYKNRVRTGLKST